MILYCQCDVCALPYYIYRHREELEELLRNITMERKSILDALVWCMEHADGAQEVRL